MSFAAACLIIVLAFVTFLVIGFFIGFWRGLKKSSLNLALSSISLLFAFFFTPVITGAVLGINISTSSGTQTLSDYILSFLTNDASINQLISNAPSFKTLIYALPQALANIAMFLVLVLLFELVFYIIYKIIAAIFFRKDKKKEDYKPHRVWGGVVGTVKTLIIIMFAFMPITALARTANNVFVDEQSYFIEAETARVQNESLADKIPQQAKVWIKAYTNSPFGFVGGMFGIDNAMFDYLTEVKIDNEKLYIRKEIPAAVEVYNVYSELSFASKNGTLDYSKLNFDNIDTVYENLTNGELFNVVSEFLAGYLENYKTIDIIDYTKFGDFTQVLDSAAQSIKSYEGGAKAFFKNDIDKLYASFKELANSGMLENVSFTGNVLDIIKTLTTDYLEATQNVVENIFNMNIVRSGIAPIADKAINLIIKDAEKVVVDTSEWTQAEWEKLSGQLLNISTKLHLVINEIDFETLLNNPMELLKADKQYNIDNIFEGLGEIVDELRKIEIFKNSSGKPIIDKLLNDARFSLPAAAVYDNDGKVVIISNYKELFNFMLTPFKEMKNFGIFETLSDSTASQTEVFKKLAEVCKSKPNALSNIVMPLYQIEPTKTILFDNVLGKFSNNLIDFTVLKTYEDWKTDFSQISTLLITLTDNKVGEQTYLEYILSGNSFESLISNMGDKKISEILTPMLGAKSTKAVANSMFDLCSNAVNSILNNGSSIVIEKNSTFKKDDVNDQTLEVGNIFDAFMPIFKEINSGITSLQDLNRPALGILMDNLKLNRYRMIIDANKTEKGAFADMFDAIIGELESKYGMIVSFKSADESDYSRTDFTAKMQELDNEISKLPLI